MNAGLLTERFVPLAVALGIGAAILVSGSGVAAAGEPDTDSQAASSSEQADAAPTGHTENDLGRQTGSDPDVTLPVGGLQGSMTTRVAEDEDDVGVLPSPESESPEVSGPEGFDEEQHSPESAIDADLTPRGEPSSIPASRDRSAPGPVADSLPATGLGNNEPSAPIVSTRSDTAADPSAGRDFTAAAAARESARKQPPVVEAGDSGSEFFTRLAAFFDNQTPQISPTQTGQGPSGQVSGLLNAVDPDSARLTFTVDEEPTYGSAAVSPDGTWTYVPDPEAAATGVTDSFRVKVSDAASGFAIHGLAGLVHLLTFGLFGTRGDSSVGTVMVNVTPVATDNMPPTASYNVIATNPVTGVATVQVTGGDPDGDPLSYSAPAVTLKGAVTIDGTTGTLTYVPTPDARHAAARLDAAQADTTDELTVTVSDGRGGVATVAISIAISPANTAPTGVPVIMAVDPVTGTVTGTVTGSDSDGDALSYSGTTNTAKGTVTVTAAGSFTYTPTATARQNAGAPGATPADLQDSFTVTIADGYGAVTPVTVVVAVTPGQQSPPVPGQLSPDALALEGFFRVPTGPLSGSAYANLAYGGMAMATRVVDGERRFFLTGHRYANDPLIELIAPESLGRSADAAPVATLFRYWGDIYDGQKVTADEPRGSEPNANWTEGLLWDEAAQRLLWSYGNWYAASGANNPVLGATTLGDDGTINVQGPWRTSADSQQTRSFAVHLTPAVSAAAGGATLGLGGKLQSINATASWGISLHGIELPADDLPAGSTISANTLASHPIAPTEQRGQRTPDYEVARNLDGSLDAAGTQPAVGGVGYWTELDETTGAVFVTTGTSNTLVYAGGQASGLIWYGPDFEHGVRDGTGSIGTGNHAQFYRPVLWLVSEDDVIASAEGRLEPHEVNPYATIDLVASFSELAFLNGLSAGQPVFVEEEGRLYVPFPGGVTDGQAPYPIVVVFSVSA